MSEASRREVRAGLGAWLARLCYALALSRSGDAADDILQATCPRAIGRADQYAPETRLDRWPFSILRSLRLNEIRAGKVRELGGPVDAEKALISDGAKVIETNIVAPQSVKRD
jgi:RNA polymerase sigma-70 factor (ECF subfamily)